MTAAPYYLIGAGGHAKVLVDILDALHISLSGYVDPAPSAWLAARGVAQVSEAELLAALPNNPQLIIGFVGLDCDALSRRLSMIKKYETQGAIFPALIHPSATVSPHATLASGVQVLPGAVVNSFANIAKGAVINSSSVVEHDATIGEGAHIAPRACVLGGGKIGACAYVGAGAVVVQNASVEPSHFVKSLTVVAGS